MHVTCYKALTGNMGAFEQIYLYWMSINMSLSWIIFNWPAFFLVIQLAVQV